MCMVYIILIARDNQQCQGLRTKCTVEENLLKKENKIILFAVKCLKAILILGHVLKRQQSSLPFALLTQLLSSQYLTDVGK